MPVVAELLKDGCHVFSRPLSVSFFRFTQFDKGRLAASQFSPSADFIHRWPNPTKPDKTRHFFDFNPTKADETRRAQPYPAAAINRKNDRQASSGRART